ncbi:MAG: TonB-dependent receptor [Gemmatimonas sp.]|nr:TonB-dependent receptor [Gemmatimonas sp.]
MSKRWLRAAWLGGLAVWTAVGVADLSGQAGMLSGRVIDSATGEAVEGAVVEVTGDAEQAVVSGSDGRWSVGQLPAGSYTVRATHLAFAGGEETVVIANGPVEAEVQLSQRALPLDAVVVTAGRRLQRLAEVPVATELVTRQELERSGVGDLSQVLVERLGIQVDGGLPAGEGVMLQGLSSERVLLLVDGQPLVGRIGGNLDVSRIPLSAVERVEVVKGAQSSMYGSEAMGGVINIITRQATGEPWRVGVEMTAGTQGRLDGSGSIGGTAGGISYLGDVGRRMTELTPGRAQTNGAIAERWDGLFKLGSQVGQDLRLHASALVLDERQRWQTGTLFQFADNRQWTAQVGAEWTWGSHRLAPALSASDYTHLSRSATGPQPVEGSGEEEAQRLYEAELIYGGSWRDVDVDGGVELKREEISSDRVVDAERNLHTVEPFAQLSIPLGGVRLVPGARISASEQWGTRFTPRIAALIRPTASIAVRASIGRGYRAPSFKELALEFLNASAGGGYTVRGNPDLQPETSTNLSLAAEWSNANLYLRASGYANRFDDFIETRLVGDSSGITVYTYGNVSDGFTRGVELEGGVTRGRSRVEAGYAFLQAEDGETEMRLLSRPAHSGHVMVEQLLPFEVSAAVTATYTGATPIERTAEGTIDRSGFLRFDVRATRELWQDLTLSVGSRNVLDAEPENWPGYGGRHVYVGFGVGLGVE